MRELFESVDHMCSTAIELRAGVKFPGPHAGPPEIVESLLDVRRRTDRVEELLRTAVQIRHRLERIVANHRAAYEDRYNTVSVELRSAPVRRGDEYSTAKERHAEASLLAMDERRLLRSAEDQVSVAAEGVDVLRLLHRGLDGARQDLLALLRTLQFESHLER